MACHRARCARRRWTHAPSAGHGHPVSASADVYLGSLDMDGALVFDPAPADLQDRDGAVPVLRLSRRTFPLIAEAFTYAYHADDTPANATVIAVEIVREPQIRSASPCIRGLGGASGSRSGSAVISALEEPQGSARLTAFLYAVVVLIFVRRLTRSA